MIIIIKKKTYLQFISTKKKQNVLVKKLRKRNKWHKVKKGEIQSFKIRSP